MGTIGVLALTVLLAVVPDLTGANVNTGCAIDATPVASPIAGDANANDRAAPTDDLSIIDSMLQQHTRAMSLANEALQNAQDSQVRRMALRIAEGHAGEMQLLRSWRSSWFPDAANVAPSRAAQTILGSLGAGCSGDEFDRAFLELLRAELQAELAEAEIAVANAVHIELRDFASSLTGIRTAEIRTIDTLLAAH